jgi:hypothetical protein
MNECDRNVTWILYIYYPFSLIFSRPSLRKILQRNKLSGDGGKGKGHLYHILGVET